jgi:hypothetical protein
MIRISRLNSALFVIMFILFVIAKRSLEIIDVKIAGIDYIIWAFFILVLTIINGKNLSLKFFIPKTYFRLFLLLLFFCFLNYLVVDVSLNIYLQGTFFSFLFAFCYIYFYNIKIDKEDFFFIVEKICFFITFMAILIYVERLLVPNSNYQFLRGVQTITKDSGLAATLLSINIGISLFLFIKRRKSIFLLISIFSFITIILLLFLKAIVASLLSFGLFIHFFLNKKTKKIILGFISVLFMGIALILGEAFYKDIEFKIEFYFGQKSDKAQRNILYNKAFEIAADYFPYGSGQGTFGSYPVGKNYSKIYTDYGLDKTYGFRKEDALSNTSNFIFDTYWSHILGEMGFIATFFYLWLWFYPLKTSKNLFQSENQDAKLFAFLNSLIIIVIFVQSFALSIPEQLTFIMLYAGLGSITNRYFKEKLLNNK